MDKRFVISALIALLAFLGATPRTAEPDFAFPREVASASRSRLAKAMKKGNDVDALSALIDLTIASTIADSDSCPSALNRISTFATEARTGQGKALATLLLATCYTELYDADPSLYDRRNGTVESAADVPDDYRAWSGDMFRNKVYGLIDTALSFKQELTATPLADYRRVIECQKEAAEFYPTLYDFVATRAIALIRDHSRRSGSGYLPASLIAPATESEMVDLQYVAEGPRRVLKLYFSLLQLHPEGSAPWIIAQNDLLEYVCQASSGEDRSTQMFETLRVLYDRLHVNHPYAALLLESMEQYCPRDDRPWLYDRCVDFLRIKTRKDAPSWLADNVNAIAERLATQRVGLDIQSAMAPGRPVGIKADVSNVNEFFIDIYRLTDLDPTVTNIKKSDLRELRPETTIAVNVAGKIPFECDTVVSHTFTEYGHYAVVPRFNGADNGDYRRVNIVSVTNLYAGIMNYGQEREIVVVDPVSGKPVDAVSISLKTSNKPKEIIGTTTTDGVLKADNKLRGTIFATKNGITSPSFYMGDYYETKLQSEAANINILTSLSLYRPGDTMEWAVVCTLTRRNGSVPAADREVMTVLYGANGLPVDTVTVTTDRWGRARGEFALPEGCLTGSYSIRATSGKTNANKWFTVSDYKMPTYEIILDQPLLNYPADGDVTLRGTVKTYSGFSMPDTKLSVELSSANRWRRWWNTVPVSYYSTDTQTAVDGNFSLTLPATLLHQAPYPDGYFSATITATSPSGESQQAVATFAPHSRRAISVGALTNIDVSKPATLDVTVTDPEGNPVTAEVDYTIATGDVTVARGRFNSGEPVDWSAVPRGCYDIIFSLPDIAGSALTVNNVCIYRPIDKYSPSPELLWTPQQRVVVAGKNAEILVGTVARSTAVLMSVSDGQGYFSQNWLDLEPRLHHIPVEVPDTCRSVTCTLSAVNDFRWSTVSVEVVPQRSIKGLRLETTSFRDKVVPGTRERWTFKVTDLDGKPVQAALMLDMFNKALDRLAPQSWSISAPMLNAYSYRYNLAGISNRVFSDISLSGTFPQELNIEPPTFQTWNESLMNSTVRFRGMLYKSVDYCMAAMPKMEYSNGADEESADTVSSTTEAEAADTGATAQPDDNGYRPSEIALAMFRPMLTTDEAGELALAVEMPLANTTWQLYAKAFSADMLIGSLDRLVVSSKPLMVQSNLPRFLRTGDNAVCRAMVMNNSSDPVEATSVVELFNPATGETLLNRRFVDKIEAGRSVTLSVETGVIPDDISVIGYRVKSSADGFSDGEQSAIPILPGVTPVIESVPFYSSPGDKLLTVEIPGENTENPRLTLQYCENPLWTVVSALPGLRATSPLSSVSAAETLYGACTALSIVKNNPEIGAAIRTWTAGNQTDSVLVSMLERNSDLKTVLLQATPWMVNAMTDSERMTRLSLLFDAGETERTINGAIDILARNVTAEGALSWIKTGEQQNPSFWATVRVLSMLGALSRQGCLPDERRLQVVIDGAIQWLDRYVAEAYSKDRQSVFPEFAFIRQEFPAQKMPTATQRAYNATIEWMIASWKDFDIEAKARTAVVLERASYHQTARLVLRSIMEYAIDHPVKGVTWRTQYEPYGSVSATAAILLAIHAVDPSSDAIDGVRRWLILQKEALDWGNSSATTAAIHAIVSTSKRWIKPAQPASFYIDGREFSPASAPQRYSGYLNTALPPSAAGEKIEIVKGGDAPSYGAIYCQYRSPITHVEPAASEDLSIAKSLYVRRGTSWTPVSTDTKLKPGDRIKVELLVTAGRNIDYVAITDQRPACLEPADQLPETKYNDGLWVYRENLDTETRMFISTVPRGVYRLAYETFVNTAGQFISGIATVQSQYAPSMTAHSGASVISVVEP